MRYGLVGELVRSVSRFAMIGVIGSMAAACSSDAMRFSDTPFANPFAAKQEPGLTGSIEKPAPRMARSAVQSAPLAPVATRTASAPAYNRPTAAASSPRSGPAGWSVEGGTSITVGQGDSLSTISNRYGVPTTAILSANGVSASQVTAGRRLVIPVYSTAGRQAQHLARAPLPAARPTERRIETLATAPIRPRPGQAEPRATGSVEPKAARHFAAVPLPAAKADAKIAAKPAAVGKIVKSEPLPSPKAKIEAKVDTKAMKADPAKVAAKPVPAAKVALAAPAKSAEPAKPSREPDATASLPPAPAAPSAEFRWPARGRVISGFGGSGANEGINIAVPDGTPVKAAEGGTVAYAGSEVKGYGNLVLIRHDNGYVSAYAHNGDVEVKRGQKVTRGQTIAKSGQTGNVTSPQIHFEIRKGATPVDPMKYLASN